MRCRAAETWAGATEAVPVALGLPASSWIAEGGTATVVDAGYGVTVVTPQKIQVPLSSALSSKRGPRSHLRGLLNAQISGRGGAIRTLDLLNPIQVRYQAAPRPDGGDSSRPDGRAPGPRPSPARALPSGAAGAPASAASRAAGALPAGAARPRLR